MSYKIAVCGFGKMGQLRAQSIEASQRAEIVKVYDSVYEDEPPYARATSIEDILDDPGIDAVFVCLPNFMNKAVTIDALQRGKHVFCEKPPAFPAQAVDDIIIAKKASGCTLMYGFNHRQHSGVLRMMEIISSREYGRPLWARGRYGKSVDAQYLTGWRAEKEKAGGGILIDQGIHMLDLLLQIAGRPFDEVSAMVSNMYWKTPGIEDNVFALMRVKETGFAASLHSTMTQWRHLFSLEVFLERGYCVLNGLKTSSGTYGEEVLSVAKNRSVAPAATWDDEERISFADDLSWDREREIFLQAIETGKQVP